MPRLTPKRLAFLLAAAEHPKGSILPRVELPSGGTAWLTPADETALEELGLADSLDDCGHIQGTPDPDGEHRTHPHVFRITDQGRAAARAGTTPTKGKTP
ncbi:hypothetical protein QQY66_49035 [Streptomyces sp. DG2A-72]|uniref:hypothetical protein n=1 Tax=Streptomyces sp. DG2A-72 TaxID=3051386 RepID=UPI00265BCDCA|nr:hypothetical protein [Streptomyces sp. DG2A-72]MDO0939259.1 hypothetical protein [Streptomyces sp. DG2A-72]